MAKRLAPIQLIELGLAHTLLKLNFVARHGKPVANQLFLFCSMAYPIRLTQVRNQELNLMPEFFSLLGRAKVR
ncbi:MAG: hypothetical protein WCC41_13905, partial [Rhodomicrobium sp.]